jgi:phenylpropionate dioxygenase-like ring-hydroxylating dioxygenase large terminal subunit
VNHEPPSDDRLLPYWYAVATSAELRQDTLLSKTPFSLPLVLWRDQRGRARAFLDRCLHRSAPLSAGRMHADGVACPYHGWCFDREGRLASIPTESADQPPSLAAHLVEYSCCEAGGLVWVWPTHAVAASGEPAWPERQPADRWFVLQGEFRADCTDALENFLDVPHTAFVHRGWFRRPRAQRIEVEVETDKHGVTARYRQDSDQIGFVSRVLNPRAEPVTHIDRFLVPSTVAVEYRFGGDRRLQVVSTVTPLGAGRCAAFGEVRFRLGAFGLVGRMALRWYVRRVLQQDYRILALQRENLDRLVGGSYLSTSADLPQVRMRQYRDRLQRGLAPPAPQREQAQFRV